ncbi:DUF2802 domain-containing protein [Piscirickettsia litoralis]|uniref:DUF2802 domain-containing protein n=1 Tax=Piscirickettsia litoralis TaxID=1891921 RepID=A0ABX3A7W9_9GAMM|nr:DUF2802 domain-containing protein [Piscirickettsia litoralis]ODN43806.1 hypothetical protein BGC07_14005 [Piscirickettsia litoralis]
MMDFIVHGSFLVTLLLLCGFLYYFWRCIKRYRRQLNELSAHCHVFMSSSIGVGQRLALLERYLGRDLYQELNQDAFPEREENLYQQASKLAALGMGKKELIEGFDLTDTEAELLQLMSKKQSAMSDCPGEIAKKSPLQKNKDVQGIQQYKNYQQD